MFKVNNKDFKVQPSQTLYIIQGKRILEPRERNNMSLCTCSIIILQYAEGKHYNAVNGELLCFGSATCFYFQNDSSFITK